MSVLKQNFDYAVDQCSPSMPPAVMLTIEHDAEGATLEKFITIDESEAIKSNGTSDMWLLGSLLKAGIDPKFGIHTGDATHLEGVDTIKQFASEADKIINDSKEE